MSPNVHCSSITIAKMWLQPKCPWINEWIKKIWYIYSMEYYSVTKRNEVGLFIETCMDLENAIQNKVRKRKTDSVY